MYWGIPLALKEDGAHKFESKGQTLNKILEASGIDSAHAQNFAVTAQTIKRENWEIMY